MRISIYRTGYGNTTVGGGSAGSIDFAIPLTLPLLLTGTAPTDDTELVTKQYVDDKLASLDVSGVIGPVPAARLPAYLGDDVTSGGNGIFYLTNTGVLTGEYSKYTVDSKGRIISAQQLGVNDLPPLNFGMLEGLPTTVAGYGITDVEGLYGDPMTGYLEIYFTPTAANHIVSKQYVDQAFTFTDQEVAYYTGDIITRADAVCPSGYLRANGGEVLKASYPTLYLKIGDSQMLRSIPGYGRPWEQQHAINKAANTNFSAATALDTTKNGPYAALSSGAMHQCVVVTKNKIVRMGGLNTSGSAATKMASMTIYEDGTESTWTVVNMNIEFYAAACVVAQDHVYILGGYMFGSPSNLVYRSPIDTAGSVNPYFSATGCPSLPELLQYHKAFVVNNRIYVLGGIDNTPTATRKKTVYYSDIQPSGDLSPWEQGTDLPDYWESGNIAVIKDRVYVMGGYNNTGVSDKIYSCEINQHGDLGFWMEYPLRLPRPMANFSVLVTDSVLNVFGGLGSGNSYADNVYGTAILPDGHLAGWGQTSYGGSETTGQTGNFSYLTTREDITAVSTKNGIYMFGGRALGNSYPPEIVKVPFSGGLNDYTPYFMKRDAFKGAYLMGAGQPWKQLTHIAETAGPSPTWITVPALPHPVTEPFVFVTNQKVYVMGGKSIATGLAVDLIQEGYIDENGVLDSWSISGSTLPGRVYAGEGVILPTNWTTFMLLMSGHKNDLGTTSDLIGYEIDPRGEGNSAPMDLSSPRDFYFSPSVRNFATVVTKKMVHILGGLDTNNNAVSTIYSSYIYSSGEPAEFLPNGNMVDNNSVTVSIAFHKVAQVGSFVFLLGGSKNGGYNTDIYRYTIAADGSLRGLTKISGLTLNAITNYADVYVNGNIIYLFPKTVADTIIRLSVDLNGNLTEQTPLTAAGATGGSSAFVFATSSRLYAYGSGFNHYLSNPDGGKNSYQDEYYRPTTVMPFDWTANSDTFRLPDTSHLEQDGVYSYIKT